MKRTAPALALAALLSACASGPDYQRPPVALPAAFQAVPAAAPAPSAAADPADTLWWKAFGDPALDALVSAAIEGNRDLRVAVARIQEYQGRAKAVGAERYPTLNGRVGAGRERMSERRAVPLPLGVSPLNNEFATGLEASWELDLWGKLKRGDEAALADLLAAEEARRAVVMMLIADVTSGYARLLLLDAEVDLLQQQVKQREQQIALQEKMLAGGSATEIAIERTRAEISQLKSTIAQRRRALAETENALSQLAGRAPGPVPRGRRLAELQPPGVPGGLPSDLLERRPDVRRAEQELVAANARIGVAKAQFLPTISLTGTLGAASTALSDLTLRSANTYGLGVGLLGMLFDFGRVEGNVQAAEARRLQLAEAYAAAAGQALREVEDALAARQRNAEREQADQERVATLERIVALQRKRADGGLATELDVLAADIETKQAALVREQSRHDGIALSIALFKAMGGGWIDLAAPPPRAAAAAPGAAQ